MLRHSLIPILGVFIVLGLALWLWWWLRRKKQSQLVQTSDLGAAGAWLKAHPDIERPKYLEIEDEKVYYIQTGRGPDLILLHGIGASVFTWRFLIKPLSAHYRVTALDIPGFGRSTKNVQGDYGLDAQRKRINRFLDGLKIRRAYLVGSSMGGAIALWMAHEDSERFPKVAALAAATSPEFIPKSLSRVVARTPFLHKTLTPQTMRLILNNIVAKRELISNESIEAYLEPFLDKGISVRTFIGALQLLGDLRMPQCFQGMKSDVLLIQGERDRMVSMNSLKRLSQIIRTAEVVVSPTGGHHIMEDEPEWTTAEILRFMGEA